MTQDVADRIPLEYLLLLKERSDKFISNVFRHRIDLLLSKTDFYQCKVCMRLLTLEQANLVSCTGFRGDPKDEDKLVASESYYTAHGEWFTRHALQASPIDKVALMRFLRDEKRICWLEIYLKVFASSEPPLQCAECHQFYNLTTSGLCYGHPERSEYQRLRGIRQWPCCGNDFYFSTLLCDGVMNNLLDNETAIGCVTKFHKPLPKYHKHEHNLLVPQRYMAIKDDIPGFHLNTVRHPGSENPMTLPTGYDFEIPLSLNAETCLSEFRNVEKAPKSGSGSARNNKHHVEGESKKEDDAADLSDLLYNAYSDAQKSR